MLPQPSTVSYFACDLGVISDIQIGEVMYKNDNVTFSWDSTSVEEHHIDEMHISEMHISTVTIPATSYMLQLSTLAGGIQQTIIPYSYLH